MHYCSSFGQQGSFNEYKLQGSFRQQATNYRALLRDWNSTIGTVPIEIRHHTRRGHPVQNSFHGLLRLCWGIAGRVVEYRALLIEYGLFLTDSWGSFGGLLDS